MPALSPRLLAVVNALPLRSGMRVLEIGCGPGAMAREIARRIGAGHVLAIDRSAKAIAQARAASGPEMDTTGDSGISTRSPADWHELPSHVVRIALRRVQ